MNKDKDYYIESYKSHISDSRKTIENIKMQRKKDESEGRIPNHLLDSEETKEKKNINRYTQLLNAMGIESTDF